jgi:hypothetical protein
VACRHDGHTTGGGEQYGTEPSVEWRSVTSGRAGTGCVLPGVGRRRKLASKLYGGLRGGDGKRVDGLVMGYWDRPFDGAVDLMNEWRTRYPAAR